MEIKKMLVITESLTAQETQVLKKQGFEPCFLKDIDFKLFEKTKNRELKHSSKVAKAAKSAGCFNALMPHDSVAFCVTFTYFDGDGFKLWNFENGELQFIL